MDPSRNNGTPSRQWKRDSIPTLSSLCRNGGTHCSRQADLFLEEGCIPDSFHPQPRHIYQVPWLSLAPSLFNITTMYYIFSHMDRFRKARVIMSKYKKGLPSPSFLSKIEPSALQFNFNFCQNEGRLFHSPSHRCGICLVLARHLSDAPCC